MKYCRPVYSALNKVNHGLALETFEKYGRSFLHPIARQMVEKVSLLYGELIAVAHRIPASRISGCEDGMTRLGHLPAEALRAGCICRSIGCRVRGF